MSRLINAMAAVAAALLLTLSATAGVALAQDSGQQGEPVENVPNESHCTEGGRWAQELSTAIDQDGDGYVDDNDQFPLNAYEVADSDSDCVGDNADVFPNDVYEWADTDLDGVGDVSDAFPSDPDESVDSDGDGIGDNADLVDDNDVGGDETDAAPLDPTSLDAGEWDEFMTGDPELDALMLEILRAGDADYTSSTYGSSYGSSSSLYSSSYGSGTTYNPYASTRYQTSSGGSSGTSLRALKFFILLPLLAIRWVMRSGDK